MDLEPAGQGLEQRRAMLRREEQLPLFGEAVGQSIPFPAEGQQHREAKRGRPEAAAEEGRDADQPAVQPEFEDEQRASIAEMVPPGPVPFPALEGGRHREAVDQLVPFGPYGVESVQRGDLNDPDGRGDRAGRELGHRHRVQPASTSRPGVDQAAYWVVARANSRGVPQSKESAENSTAKTPGLPPVSAA